MNISKAIQSAFENHQKGNLKEAESLYKEILKKQPDNPDILNMLGALFCQLANYDSAIKYLRRALQCGLPILLQYSILQSWSRASGKRTNR